MQLNDTFDPIVELAESSDWGEPKLLSVVEMGTMTVHVISIYEIENETLIFRKTGEEQLGPFKTIDLAVAGILY